VTCIRVRAKTLEQIDRHAEEAYPEECCGIVLEVSGEEFVRPVANIQNRLHEQDPVAHPRDARTAYFMEPKALARVLEEAQQPGNRLKLFYHSHPDHDAYFSAEDRAAAMPLGEPSYPEAVYLVVSVRAGRVADRLAVAWDPERGDYEATPLEVLP
jgi:proteasome lid subunit RPN8/RPN11